MINVLQPSLGDQELAAVREVFASNWLGPGTKVRLLIERFSEYVNTMPEQLLPVTSCTEALFQILAALQLRPGDQVLLPTISFVGAANAVRAAGGEVVLCDVDPRTLNPTEEHIADHLTERTRAVIVLHYGGVPGRVAQIAELVRGSEVFLIEDAACALGSKVLGRNVGTLGNCGVWSFDAMKLLVTGDGGMLRVNSEELLNQIKLNSYFGIEQSGFSRSGSLKKWWEIDPQTPGRLSLMNDLAAAIGLVQLSRVQEFIAKRREVANIYDRALSEIDLLRIPRAPDEGIDLCYYFYWIQVRGGYRDQLADFLLSKDIYTTYRYWPLHKTRMYAGNPKVFPGAEEACANTLLLPLHQGLSYSDVERVIATIIEFLSKAKSVAPSY